MKTNYPCSPTLRCGKSFLRTCPAVRKLLFGLPVLALAMMGNVKATSLTWSATPTSASMASGADWVPANAPATTNGLIFGVSNTTTLTDDLASGFVVGGIAFNAGASAFTINSGTPLGLSTSVVDNATNTEIWNTSLALTSSLPVTVLTGGNLQFGGLLSDGGSNFGFTKYGQGTFTIDGSVSNTYTGVNNIRGGTLLLDFANMSTPANLLNSSSTLQFQNGGVLSIKGKSSGVTSQTLGNLTLNANGSLITLDNNGGGGTTLTLGNTWTRSAGATLAINISAGGTVKSTPAGGGAIQNSVIGYATVTDSSGSGFATLSGGNIVRLTAGTSLANSSNGATTNFITGPTGSSTTGSPYLTMNGSFSANSLTIDTTSATGANALDLGGASHVLTLTSSGLLLTGSQNFTIQDGQVGAAGSELIVHTMGSGVLTIAGTVGSGAASLTKDGSGTLVLSGANTYSGITSIDGGTLQISAANNLGTATGANTLQMGAPNSAIGATLDSTSGSYTLAQGIQLSGPVTIEDDSGTLTLSNTIAPFTTSQVSTLTFTGAGNTTVTSTMSSTGLSLIKTGAGTLTLSSADTVAGLSLQGGVLAGGGSLTNSSTAYDMQNGTVSLALAGSAALTKSTSGTVTLSGTNSYTGVTTVSGGLLQFTNEVSLYNDATASWTSSKIVVANGATIAFNVGGAGQFTTGDVTTLLTNLDGGTGNTGLQAGSTIGFDTTNASGGTFTLPKALANTTGAGGGIVGVTKLGTGTLIVNVANTYTGATTINGGTLEVDSPGSLASGSAVGIGGASASGTPTLSGTGLVSGAVTVASAGGGAAGTISPGSIATPLGTLTVGSISFQNGSTFAVNLNSSSSSNLVINGAATFAGTDNITFSGSTGATTTTGVGNYVLATIGSGANLTTGAFTGTAPTFYRLLGTGTQLNLTHEATIGTITATPAASDIITGGSTTFGVTVSNTAPTGSSSLSAGATSGANTTGSIAAGTITAAGGATSSSASGLSFTGTTVGAGQAGTFTVSDPNADNASQTGSVSVNVHGHASGSLSASTLNIGNVHVGYTSPVTSSNSVTASNASGYLVNLKGSDTTAGNISMTSVSGVAAGGASSAITATLATGQGVGSFGNQTYTYADDSTLSGASSNVGTTSVTVTGQIYSGAGTWLTNGSGSWGTLTGSGSEMFGANWGANQGSPGLDPSFTGVDTATFGPHAVGSATVSLNNASPNLNSVTFSSPSTSYNLAPGSGTSTGLTFSGTTPSINVTGSATAGSQTISAPIILGANTSVNVGGKQTLNLNGVTSGLGESLTYTGPGATVVTVDNTYTGGTTISGGTTYINNTGGASYTAPTSSANRTITPTNATGSGTGTGAVTVQSGGTLAGSGTIESTSGGVAVQSGGTLSSGGIQSGTSAGLGLTINNATGLSSALLVNGGGTLSFALGSTVNGPDGSTFNNPSTNSTYLSLTGTAVDQIFSNTSTADSIVLTDLTAGSPTVTLTLRYQNPYLLIQTDLGNNADFANVWTSGGLGKNGYVLGVSTGVGNNYIAFNITMQDINGNNLVTPTNYEGLQLYLNNGDLEVVPEPGTWALMLGGLALLIVIQRRRRGNN